MTLSIIKYFVLIVGDMMPFYILFALYGLVAIGLLIYYKPKFAAEGADITPFLVMFCLEATAWFLIVLS